MFTAASDVSDICRRRIEVQVRLGASSVQSSHHIYCRHSSHTTPQRKFCSSFTPSLMLHRRHSGPLRPHPRCPNFPAAGAERWNDLRTKPCFANTGLFPLQRMSVRSDERSRTLYSWIRLEQLLPPLSPPCVIRASTRTSRTAYFWSCAVSTLLL